jgi:hypothetical protein
MESTMNPQLKKAISDLIAYARYDVGDNLEDSIKVIEAWLTERKTQIVDQDPKFFEDQKHEF